LKKTVSNEVSDFANAGLALLMLASARFSFLNGWSRFDSWREQQSFPACAHGNERFSQLLGQCDVTLIEP
jgi:hypothetical protein